MIPYTSYGRFKLRFGHSVYVSKSILEFGFSRQASQLLQVQVFVLATNAAFRVMFAEGSAQPAEQHKGIQAPGVALEPFCKPLQGRQRSDQLCPLAEGFSTRCCRCFSCFALQWRGCWCGHDLWDGNLSLQLGTLRLVVWKAALGSQGALSKKPC